MSARTLASKPWARILIALLAFVPVAVWASTVGVLKKFRRSSSAPYTTRPRAGVPFASLLVNSLGTESSGAERAGGLPSERVERHEQRVGSAIVQGTWVQTVRDAVGHVLYEAGAIYDAMPEGLREQVAREEQSRAVRLASLESQLPELANAAQRFEPELEIVMRGEVAEMNWLVDFVSADETRAYRARAAVDGRVIDVKEIGTRLSEGVGNVFPRGPKRSPVAEVAFAGLDGTGALTSPRAMVSSATAAPARSAALDFRFTPDDERFDQVQAYFYVEEILSRFKARFDAEPRAQLQVRVQVGERSNAAYYLRNTIRLGPGDDTRYRGLARDPSVVMHEVGHALVDRYAGLPSEGEGGSLNEAFADFFAASALDNPAMGEASFLGGPFVRTLENSAQAPGDLGRGLYKDSQVFSGALWDMRVALGAEKSEFLAFRTLSRLGPEAKLVDFGPAARLAAASFLDAADREKVETVLKARGLGAEVGGK